MKIKNKDGTINSMPICVIFTVIAIAVHLFVFGLPFKEGTNIITGEQTTAKITTKGTTTVDLCNNCSMRFLYDSIDVSTNGELDIAKILVTEGVQLSSIKFSVSDKNLVTLSSYGNTIRITTGNLEGSAVINAKFTDIDVKIVVNVVHPAKATMKFEYDSYFVSKNSKIYPQLETYPYGYKLDGIQYTSVAKGVINVNKSKNEIMGKKVGSDTLRATVGNLTASTTIYVVENLITIKNYEGGAYKKARKVTPAGNSFDFVIQFEDKNKVNYDNKNLNISFDRNDLNANVSFVKKHTDVNSYIYHMEINGTGTSIMRVELPDGSFTLFEINK